jgi:hypothetical protein
MIQFDKIDGHFASPFFVFLGSRLCPTAAAASPGRLPAGSGGRLTQKAY